MFCSGDLADEADVLAVDTVFWVAAAHLWEATDRPPVAYSDDVDSQSALWRYHLRFGGRGGHAGRYTYEGALHPQDKDCYSHLPLDVDGNRAQVYLHELSAELCAAIKSHRHGKYPTQLSDSQLKEVLHHLRKRTATQVIHEIVLDDAEVEAQRAGQAESKCHKCPGDVDDADEKIETRDGELAFVVGGR